MERKNLLIVGAGFSYNAGLPLASEFTSSLINTRRLSLKGPSRALVKCISDFVDKTFAEGRKARPGDWPELEDVFTLVDLSANTGHHLGEYSASELRLIRRAMIVRMIRMLSQAYRSGMQTSDEKWKLLEQLFVDFNVTNTAVLSMNWDTVIEAGLARTQGIDRVAYGCHARASEFDTKDRLNFKAGTGKKIVCLTKLHGSVNWLYCDSCRNVFWVAPAYTTKVSQTLFRDRDWEAVRRLTGRKQAYRTRRPACPYCGVKALGTRFATFSFRKALDFPMFAASWRTAERHMQEATHWVFFGYSMPSADFEFKYLIKRVQLARKVRPCITVITGGDGAAETVKRFKRFFGTAEHELTYFTDGLTSEVLAYLRSIGLMSPS